MPAVIVVAVLRRVVNSERFRSGVRSAFARDKEGDQAASSDIDDVMEAPGPGLIGRLARVLLIVAAAAGISWAIGQLIARRLSRGDESSDEFELAVVMGGKEFRSYAEQLRSGTVTTIWGGTSLDLRAAALSPGGADLELRTIMSGTEVRVPPTWRVEIDQTVSAGEFAVDLPGADDLPEGAPTLRIRATTRIGGVLVTSTRR